MTFVDWEVCCLSILFTWNVMTINRCLSLNKWEASPDINNKLSTPLSLRLAVMVRIAFHPLLTTKIGRELRPTAVAMRQTSINLDSPQASHGSIVCRSRFGENGMQLNRASLLLASGEILHRLQTYSNPSGCHRRTINLTIPLWSRFSTQSRHLDRVACCTGLQYSLIAATRFFLLP